MIERIVLIVFTNLFAKPMLGLRRLAPRSHFSSRRPTHERHPFPAIRAMPLRPLHRRGADGARLVAQCAALAGAAPERRLAESAGSGLQLRGCVQAAGLPGAEEGSARADEGFAALVAGGLRSLRSLVHPHGLARRRYISHR